MLVGCHDQCLYSLSTAAGSLRWCCELDSELYSSPFTFQRHPQQNTGVTSRLAGTGGMQINEHVYSPIRQQ